MATTSQPAASAAAASAGPETSSASRRETEVETVRTAVRMPGRLARDGRAVLALGRLDQLEHRRFVAVAQQRDRIRGAVDDLLEERLAVLVRQQRGLRPAAGVVEQHGQTGVLLAELLGDGVLDPLG